jgi:hypothetical protein
VAVPERGNLATWWSVWKARYRVLVNFLSHVFADLQMAGQSIGFVK